MRAVLLLALTLACALAAGVADAANCVLRAGGTAESPIVYSSTVAGDWSSCGGGTPATTDTVILSNASYLRFTASTTLAAIRVTNTAATWEVYAGTDASPAAAAVTLSLTGCNTTDASAYAVADALECGTEAGAMKMTGAKIYDSRTDTADLWDTYFGGNSVASSGAQIRWGWDNTNGLAIPTFAAGDIVFVLSGPNRNLAYRIAAASQAGCGTGAGNCFIDVALYDTNQAWTTNKANQRVNLAFLDNQGATDPNMEQARRGGVSDASYEANDLDRKIEVCRDNGGTSTACTSHDMIAEDSAFAGWYLFPSGASNRWGVVGNGRYLIKDTTNSATSLITGETGSRDILELVEPLTQQVFATSSGTATASFSAVIGPGFCPGCGDDFIVYRPARIAYTGSENGDGGLRFWDTDLDWTYYDFEDWSRIAINQPGTNTAADYPRLSFGRIVPWCAGNGVAKTNNGGNGCNGGALALAKWQSYDIQRLAMVDARTPANTSTTCFECNGAVASSADAATTSGSHGLEIGGMTSLSNATLGDIGCRYLGDDCIVWSPAWTSETVQSVDGVNCWIAALVGSSGNCIDLGSVTPTSRFTLKLKRMQATRWVGYDASPSVCDGAVYASGGSSNLRAWVTDSFVLDPDKTSPVVVNSTPPTGTLHAPGEAGAQNVLMLSTGGADCQMVSDGSAISNWGEGYRTLTRGGARVEQNYLAGVNSTSSQTLFGYSSDNTPLKIQSNVVVGAGNIVAVTPQSNDAAITVKNNAVSFATASSQPFGVYTSTSPSLTFSGNVVRNGTLLNCNDSTWGTANSSRIGYNAVIVPPGVPVTGGGSNCVSAMDRQLILSDIPSFYRNWWVPQLRGSVTLGPAATVGIANRWAASEMGLSGAYQIQSGSGCTNPLKPCSLQR